MKKMILVEFLVVFLLASCEISPITPVVSVEPTALSSSNAPTLEHTITLTPTPTPILASKLASTLTPSSAVLQKCILIGAETPLKEVATGTVLLEGQDLLYLLNLQSGIRYELPFKMSSISFGGVAVSPNGENLAYVEDIYDSGKKVIQQKIWVTNATGKVLANKTINVEISTNEWHWLDNEYVEFPSIKATTKDGTVILYNPFKNDWRYLSNKLPNFYDSFDADRVLWLVDYNPTMDLVAYFGRVDDGGVGIIVRDINAGRTLWQYPSMPLGFPKWSVSGDEIVAVVENQLYRINRSGEAIPLPGLGIDKSILDFALSPNGQFIAFWVGNGAQGGKADLMVYDIKNDQMVDYCINSVSTYYGDIKSWSADSKQFVVTVYLENSGKPRNLTILVDVQKTTAYEIPKEMEPLEWMNSIP